MFMTQPKPNRGAELLDSLVDLGGPEAEAVKAVVHRTQINGYRTARKMPTVEVAARIEKASDGRIPAVSWAQPARRKARSSEPEFSGLTTDVQPKGEVA